MSSEATTQIILFIAGILAAIGFIAIAADIIGAIEQNIAEKSSGLSTELSAKIEVIHATANTSVVVYADNTGSAAVELDGTWLAIDGESMPSENCTVSVVKSKRDTLLWNPSEIIEIDCNKSLSKGWHDARVFTGDISSIGYRFERE